MSPQEVAVLVGGVLAIVWVNWYFLFSGGSASPAVTGRGGVQQIDVLVRGGYSPALLRVERGVPVRIVFAREESAGCSEELVMPAFGIRRFLPPHERTTIEFTPQEAGRFEFTCGMGMLRGAVLVEDGSGDGGSR